jgi:serine protease Do
VALRDGAQGIAFALNSDTVQAVLAQLLSAARIARVQHGLSCREVLGGEGQPRQWVVVEQVAEKSPAARAGLKKGDVIQKLAGKPVFNRFDVERAFWSYQPGDRVEATVLRDGKETQAALALTRGKEAGAIASRPEPTPPRTTAVSAQPANSSK